MIAARYIFGNVNLNLNGAVRSLSNVASGVITNPQKLENTLGIVRTVAPLTSPNTVNKINMFLPIFEKLSSIIGVYSFINKAQNYAPVQSLSQKSPVEKISALMNNGNINIGKILAQPVIANNIDKIIGSVAQNVVMNNLKNTDLNSLLSSLMSQMPSDNSGSTNNNMNTNNQGNNNMNMNNNANTQSSQENNNSSIDISQLMEMFGPLLNNLTQNQNENK